MQFWYDFISLEFTTSEYISHSQFMAIIVKFYKPIIQI